MRRLRAVGVRVPVWIPGVIAAAMVAGCGLLPGSGPGVPGGGAAEPAADLCAQPRDPRAFEVLRALEDGFEVTVEAARAADDRANQVGVCVRDASSAAATTSGVLPPVPVPFAIDSGMAVDDGPAQVLAGRASAAVASMVARLADGRNVTAALRDGAWGIVLRPPFTGELVALDASGAVIHREDIPVPPPAP